MKDPEFVEQLRGFRADLQVVVAFRMLPEVVWAMPRFGTFNVHAALLPQYRGAAPINWAVINGETQTGVTTFFLDHDIDTGRIIMQEPFAIPDDADVGVCLRRTDAPRCRYRAQDHRQADSCRWQHRLHLAGRVGGRTAGTASCTQNLQGDLSHQFRPASQEGVRLHPRSVALSRRMDRDTEKEGGKAQVLKVFKTTKTGKALVEGVAVGSLRVEGKSLLVACADEWLQLDTIQISGKKRMEARDFLNGMRDIEQYKTI